MFDNSILPFDENWLFLSRKRENVISTAHDEPPFMVPFQE